MDYSPRGLKTIYLQIRAQEQLMECPNATRIDFYTQNFQEDVMLQVSSSFLHDVEQIKIDLATLRQEMRNLRTELQELRVNCMERKFRSWAPTQKGNQKTVRFCSYCNKTDIHQKGVAKKCGTKKYGECNMLCPSTRILLQYGNAELVTRILDPTTIKTWTDALIRTM